MFLPNFNFFGQNINFFDSVTLANDSASTEYHNFPLNVKLRHTFILHSCKYYFPFCVSRLQRVFSGRPEGGVELVSQRVQQQDVAEVGTRLLQRGRLPRSKTQQSFGQFPFI